MRPTRRAARPLAPALLTTALLTTAVLAGAAAFSAAPAAAITEEQAGQAVAERFPVQVLKVRPGTVEGRPVWLVTVMHTAGTSNSSFAVATLAVDRESGQLIRGFEQRERGAIPSDAPPAAAEERVTGTPPGPGSREPGDSGGASQ